jgi:hyperosmotically inducible protein
VSTSTEVVTIPVSDTPAVTTTTVTTAPATTNDTTITNDIKTKIANDATVNKTNVDVSTVNGVVNIAGVVNSESEASTLVQIAQSCQGARDVDTSKLTVKDSKQPFVDAAITAKVKGVFVREKLFGKEDISAMGIKVETNNGVVYLTGTVESKAQSDNAVSLAQGVKGVKQVESRLELKAPAQ